MRRSRSSILGLALVAAAAATLPLPTSASGAIGDLDPRGCIGDIDSNPDQCELVGSGLNRVDDLALSPNSATDSDPNSAYAVGYDDNAILHLRIQGQDLDPFGTNFGALAPKGCIAARGANPDHCATTARGLEGASSVAVSQDGESVYVTGFLDNAIVRFKRRKDGDLVPRGCIADPALNPAHCRRTAQGLAGAYDVVVAYDQVFVAGFDDSAVVSFDRNQNGRLTPTGCVSDPTQHTGCADTAKGLLLVSGLAFAPGNLYAAGNGANAIVRFEFSPKGELRPRDCIAQPLANTDGCPRTAEGLGYAESVLVTHEIDQQQSVYVAAARGAIVRFDRDSDTGRLTPRGCIGDPSYVGCAQSAPGLSGVQGMATDGDAESIYAAGHDDGALLRFDRDTASGALTPHGCVQDPDRIPIFGDICNQHAPGLAGVSSVTVTQYSESVYAAGTDDNAIVRFWREHNMP